MIALIMSGGTGTRFWPLSRRSHPKQYLAILSERTMLQMTVDRLLRKLPISDIFVVTSRDQVSLTLENLPDLPPDNIIIEPFGMNTAPCIGLSAWTFSHFGRENETMLVLPADHHIEDVNSFLSSLETGDQAARQGSHVTFGIEPTYPATGYGYIEKGESLDDRSMFHVKQFKEKPDCDTATHFIKSGNFLWNSGMFVWQVKTLIDSYRTLLPDVSALLDRMFDPSISSLESARNEIYSQMPGIPVDIGIMERAKKRIVIPVSYGWNDVGGWKALYDLSKCDDRGNATDQRHVVIDSDHCYIDSKRLVALINCSNLVVVNTNDAILIADLEHTEKVKQVVEELKRRKLETLF